MSGDFTVPSVRRPAWFGGGWAAKLLQNANRRRVRRRRPRSAAGADRSLIAVGREVVDRRRQVAVGVDRDVEVLVELEIVSRPLTDDPEVVDERLRLAGFGVELLLRDAVSLVLGSGRQPRTGELLRVVVLLHVEAAVPVSGDVEQVVERARQLDEFACAAGSA